MSFVVPAGVTTLTAKLRSGGGAGAGALGDPARDHAAVRRRGAAAVVATPIRYRGGTGGTAGDGGNGGIGCGGGGGTSYAPGGAIIDAVYDAVPNTTDTDYVQGAAEGGVASQTAPTSGADGLIVLRWPN